jgi:hypothetical protein
MIFVTLARFKAKATSGAETESRRGRGNNRTACVEREARVGSQVLRGGDHVRRGEGF